MRRKALFSILIRAGLDDNKKERRPDRDFSSEGQKENQNTILGCLNKSIRLSY
jgi:hypothetical protein